MTRRDAAWLIARAAATIEGQLFLSAWARDAKHGAEHSSAPAERESWANYRPQFFSADEFRALEAFAGALIPSDETPGAREAHVAPFIDFVVFSASEYAPDTQREWRAAVEWLVSCSFSEMSEGERNDLLTRVSAPERDRSQKADGFAHYRLMKQLIVYAFYTSRVGMIDNLEYKGLAYLTEFPGCDHPEHHKF